LIGGFSFGTLREKSQSAQDRMVGTIAQEVFTMNGTDIVTRDKLVADLKVVVADAEELLRITAGQAGDKVAAVRDKMQRGLEQAKAKLADLEGKAMEQTKAAARATDTYVHENPWKAVGIAAGAGVLFGLLISRR
jgi:ElaB/YqjD/DUF883 family membrane-anchored ribosome-binding protein